MAIAITTATAILWKIVGFKFRDGAAAAACITVGLSVSRGWDSETQAAMINHQAAILDHLDSGFRKLLGRSIVIDAELQPH